MQKELTVFVICILALAADVLCFLIFASTELF
jgi:hypothetical protein